MARKRLLPRRLPNRAQRNKLRAVTYGTRKNAKGKSEGFVLLLIVLSLLGVLGVILVTSFVSGSNRISRDAATATALAKAKDALLAYAITGDAAGRPAEFPCPSTVALTAATYGTSDAGCATRRIGRLPWRTLGIPELFDGDGEPLWYAVSNKFRPSVPVINLDTLGDLKIYAAGGTTLSADQVVAVIFSAGAPVANQIRSSTASLCATTSTTIASNTCATNYLDSGSGWNNATNAGPYIADRHGATFNDQIAYITTADFMPKIEDRITSILTRTLNNYYVTNGYYPYAANYADITWPTELNCANGIYAGRLPLYIAASPHTGAPCSGLADWQPVGDPNGLPAWFTTNQWNAAIHYVVGKAYAIGAAKTCSLPGDCLVVDGVGSMQAVFILPGIATSTQTRPSSIPINYLEAVANQEDWPTPVNYSYVTTASALPSRDRVIAVKNP